jgi:Domain of unknown function (DUF5655)/Domain of unknown function (DUF4287)
MADMNAALLTQLRNIQGKTGKTLAQLAQALAASGAAKHAEKRQWLMDRFKLGYGDANTVVTVIGQGITEVPGDAAGMAAASATAAGDDPLAAIYTGPKAALLPLHEAVMNLVRGFGEFEEAPKKTYVSLRRKKQFAMVGPATKTALELGINHKSLPEHERLKAMPPGGMCQYTTRISGVGEIDPTLAGWLKAAYDAAG